MHPINRGQLVASRELRDGFIGREHELFDQLVALIILDELKTIGIAFRIDENFRLGHVEIEAAFLHACLAKARGKLPKPTHPFLDIAQLIERHAIKRPTG